MSKAPAMTTSHPDQPPCSSGQTTLKGYAQNAIDNAFKAKRFYGQSNIINDIDNDHDVVIKQTYYKGKDEDELDYDDNVPTEEEDAAIEDDIEPANVEEPVEDDDDTQESVAQLSNRIMSEKK